MKTHRELHLQPQERTELEGMLKSGEHNAREVRRAQVLLHVDRSQGGSQTLEEVAAACLVSVGTVCNIKNRYFAGGLERALYDKARPGATPKITGEVEAHLIALSCSAPPAEHGRWTLRLLAAELIALEVVDYVSHVTVGEVLKKTS